MARTSAAVIAGAGWSGSATPASPSTSAGLIRAASRVTSATVSAAEVGTGTRPAAIAPRNPTGKAAELPSRSNTRSLGTSPRARSPLPKPRTAASSRP